MGKFLAQASTSASRPNVHTLAVALAVLVLLAGCLFTPSKALAPLPEEARAELAAMGLALGAPVYIRLFKLEAEMEVWMQRPSGTYQLFRTYPICNWSGDVGPKIKEGDKQAPEGFYVVTAQQMNPNSKFYLSFNIGYPNAYDRAHGYTGSYLMVHGGCRSQGCYAITDEAIQELYVLARDAFARGQREFPVHAFPFRMTKEAMAFRAANRWHPFWLNLQEGYDIFAQTKMPPVVGVKDRQYVFFTDQQAVPEEFKSADANDPLAPRLISGWQN